MSVIQGTANQASTRGFYDFPIEQSLRFNDDDSAYLSWTPDSAGNRKTWTWSGWVKRSTVGATQALFHCAGGSTDTTAGLLRFAGDVLNFTAWSTDWRISNRVFRDPSAWYHIVLAFDTTQATASDRVKIWINGVLETSWSTSNNPTQNTDYGINNSAIHYIGTQGASSNYADGYLAEVNFIDGTALTADSFGELKNGVWIPKDPSGLTYGTNGFRLSFADDAEVEAFNTVLYRGNGGTQSVTGMGFQPDLIWHKDRNFDRNHSLVDSVRGTNDLQSNSTAAERSIPSFVSFDSDGFTVTQNGSTNPNWNESGATKVAWGWDAGANNAVTGHSSVTYTGSGSKQSITGMGFKPDLLWIKNRDTANNHQLMNSVIGVPNNLESNTTDAEDTTNRVSSLDNDGFTVEGSYSFTNQSGQSYVAWGWDAGDGNPVSNSDGSITSTVKASAANGFSVVSWTGTGSLATVGHGLSSAPSWIIIKNRTDAEVWRVYHAGTGATVGLRLNDTTNDVDNTNTGIFNDTAPTSSVFTVNTFNSANGSGDAMIAYCFSEVSGYSKFGTYTGTLSSGNTVTTGFRPGFVMVKRTDSANNWYIYDGSRTPFMDGDGDEGILKADTSDAESTASANPMEFTDTGFVLNGVGGALNDSGGTYIYAAFAGSYSDYITDVNTDGSIDSRVKANTTTGFSIVSYTGTGTAGDSFGHGLSSTPAMIFIKDRSAANSWTVWHSAIMTNAGYLVLDGTQAANTTDTGYWDATAPSSSVVTLGTRARVNTNTNNYIAYCWAEKTGYSKFGSYTGNGSTSGPSITCGFKPAMIILKRTDSGGSWTISDNTRDTVNPVTPYLFPHASDAEATDSSNEIDFNSNGFQIKHDTRNNTSGATYIYAAFADTREAAFWLDQSGNDNDWQPVNLDHNDTLLDSPTNNFATMNPLQVATSGAPTFSDGNLQVSTPVSGAGNAVSTIGVTSGKYYAEMTIKSLATLNRANVGITGDASATITANTNIGSLTSGLDVGYFYNGTSFTNNVETAGYGDSYGVGDVIGVALNADDSQVTFYKNGVSQGAISFTSGGTYHFAVGDVSAGGGNTFECNFGQQPFKYDPPE